MFRILPSFLDDTAEDIVEYALVASFLSIVAVATLYAISPEVRRVFVEIKFALMSVTSARF